MRRDRRWADEVEDVKSHFGWKQGQDVETSYGTYVNETSFIN
jgi:hypothetical protein